MPLRGHGRHNYTRDHTAITHWKWLQDAPNISRVAMKPHKAWSLQQYAHKETICYLRKIPKTPQDIIIRGFPSSSESEFSVVDDFLLLPHVIITGWCVLRVRRKAHDLDQPSQLCVVFGCSLPCGETREIIIFLRHFRRQETKPKTRKKKQAPPLFFALLARR